MEAVGADDLLPSIYLLLLNPLGNGDDGAVYNFYYIYSSALRVGNLPARSLAVPNQISVV